MIGVLVDGRIRGLDGIGRYSCGLVTALQQRASQTVRIDVLEPAGTPRYSHAEGTELLDAARVHGADIIHALDYRIPLDTGELPVVVTVHDLLRLIHPQHCYSDAAFVDRFGVDGLAALFAMVDDLRGVADQPRGVIRPPESLHEEFYARMVALTCTRAADLVVPTATVARQVASRLGRKTAVHVSPWGVDHLPASETEPIRRVPDGRYLLYVGQARSHKGMSYLLDGFRRSRARRDGARLLCAGHDFQAGTPAAARVVEELGPAAATLGPVSDRQLRALYAGAEALVHLSEHEGFGFTPLEALAVGVRVVASDIDVLRETLGPHATFVDPADPDAVATAIDNTLATPDTSGERAARMRWAGRYRWSRHADDVLSLYAKAAR